MSTTKKYLIIKKIYIMKYSDYLLNCKKKKKKKKKNFKKK